ncbi:MAG: S-layer homology domain-containing protein [Clostridia bacterium]|nr:S-layer homology domain-containing protein [Clostridia bacterium]
MNRNLKRVLSTALTLVVMAVNFVIPAFATDTTITVSYTDLLTYGSLANRQGELYFDTTSGSLDSTTNNNRAYAPLDVWSNPISRASLNMKAGEWVRFEVTADTAGYYSVDVDASVGATPSAKFYVRTEKSILETDLPKTANQNTFVNATNLGYIYLEEGTNYVYVDHKSTSYVNFRTMTLTLDESVDATVAALVAPIASANEIGDLTVIFNDGYNQADVSNTPLTFPVNIPADGKYKVSVMGITEGSSTVSADFGDDVKTATVSRITKTVKENDVDVEVTTYGYSEIGIFSLTEGEYTLTLDGFSNYSLAWVKVEYVSPYATGVESESFVDGETVTRGTDNLTITFNDTMMAGVEATLTADGAEIPVAVDVDGTKVIVSFLETLSYGTEYLLEVTNLQGINDAEALDDRTYTFTTGDDSADEGIDAVVVSEVESYREAVTIKGTALGSTGHGIKGRTVTVTSPEGDEVETVISGDDGAFTVEFNIADGTAAGAYTYTVTTEYGATTPAVVSYVSEEEELRIIGLFEDATTSDAVYAIFEEYGEVLLVPDYAADCDSLANEDLFLAHFEGKDFAAVREVAPFYGKMLKLEQMNQATTGSYIKSNFLNQADACELIGIASDKLNLVNTDTKKTSFSDKIAEDTRTNGPSTSEEAFLERIATLLDAWILETNGITPTSLDLSDAITSAYYAGEIAIPVDFQNAQTKVKAIEVVVTTEEADLLENAEAVAEDAISNEVVIDGDTATFTIGFAYDETISYDEVGKIALQASVIGTHDIDVEASVIYTFDTGLKDEQNNKIFVDLPISVTGGSITATIRQKPEKPASRPSGSSGGGGYVAPPKEKVEEEDDKQSGYFFDDMEEASWAKDMVHTLVGKGIVSKNDERKFRPMDNITREEVVKMIVTAIGSHDAKAVSNLTDVAEDHWATSYIATAQNLGIIKGNPDGTFGLGQQITRQDLAVMVYRTFQRLGITLAEGKAEFADADAIADYAKAAVLSLEKVGVINGMGENTFAPIANATRAQTAKVIYVMMEVLGI